MFQPNPLCYSCTQQSPLNFALHFQFAPALAHSKSNNVKKEGYVDSRNVKFLHWKLEEKGMIREIKRSNVMKSTKPATQKTLVDIGDMQAEVSSQMIYSVRSISQHLHAKLYKPRDVQAPASIGEGLLLFSAAGLKYIPCLV